MLKLKTEKCTLGAQEVGMTRTQGESISGPNLGKAPIGPLQSYYFRSERRTLVLQWQNLFRILKLRTTNFSSYSTVLKPPQGQTLKTRLIQWLDCDSSHPCGLLTLQTTLRLMFWGWKGLYLHFFLCHNKCWKKTYLQQIFQVNISNFK